MLVIATGLLADDSDSLIGGDFIALVGVGYLAIGSAIGALIGQSTAPGERVLVYEARLRTEQPGPIPAAIEGRSP